MALPCTFSRFFNKQGISLDQHFAILLPISVYPRLPFLDFCSSIHRGEGVMWPFNALPAG